MYYFYFYKLLLFFLNIIALLISCIDLKNVNYTIAHATSGNDYHCYYVAAVHTVHITLYLHPYLYSVHTLFNIVFGNSIVHTVSYSFTYSALICIENTIFLHFWLDANCISLAVYLFSA